MASNQISVRLLDGDIERVNDLADDHMFLTKSDVARALIHEALKSVVDSEDIINILENAR